MPLRRSSPTSAGMVSISFGRLRASRPDRGARIDLVRAADGVGDEGLEQRRRNVVDAVEVDVLEHVQSHALAGARQAR